ARRPTPLETFGRWTAGLVTAAGRKLTARGKHAATDDAGSAVREAANATAEPEKPAEPPKSAEPDKPAEPETAGEPEKLTEPQKFAEPPKSAEPDKPAEPETAAEPSPAAVAKPRRAAAGVATAVIQRLSAVPRKVSAVPRRFAGSWSPPDRRRWMPAVAVALLATVVAAGVLAASHDTNTRNADPPVQPVPVGSPSPTAASPSPTVAPTSASPAPSRTVRPSATRKSAAPASPRPTKTTSKPTTNTPKPSISVYARGRCVWSEGRGWTIEVSVTVSNGSGLSATGTHGYDPNVGGSGTYSLSGSGTSFSGELPPNLGDNPELTGSVVSWSVTVRLRGGGTLTKSGSVGNPC
ncbi:MAG: hypothetical protein HOU81_24225, partial [Hamadaea sp.]|nr:hypothetical protein [Hamadaea sp.]